MPRAPMSRLPTALTSSTLPGLTPGILPSVGGASGAVPAGAFGVTVGAGIAVVESGVAEVVLGADEELGAVEAGVVWPAGAGVCVLDCAIAAMGARIKLAESASRATRESFAKKLLILHLIRKGNKGQTHIPLHLV